MEGVIQKQRDLKSVTLVNNDIKIIANDNAFAILRVGFFKADYNSSLVTAKARE